MMLIIIMIFIKIFEISLNINRKRKMNKRITVRRKLNLVDMTENLGLA